MMLEEYDSFYEELTSLRTLGLVGGLFRNIVLQGKDECVSVGKKMD